MLLYLTLKFQVLIPPLLLTVNYNSCLWRPEWKGQQGSVDIESISFWPTYTHTSTHTSKTLSFPFFPWVYSVACDHLDLTCIVAELVFLFCSLPLLLLSVINFQPLQFAKKKEKGEWGTDGWIRAQCPFERVCYCTKKQPPNNFSSMFNSKSLSSSALKRRAIKPYWKGLNKNSPLGLWPKGFFSSASNQIGTEMN